MLMKLTPRDNKGYFLFKNWSSSSTAVQQTKAVEMVVNIRARQFINFLHLDTFHSSTFFFGSNAMLYISVSPSVSQPKLLRDPYFLYFWFHDPQLSFKKKNRYKIGVL